MQSYHIVDAFTATPFAGNPAAVVLAPSFPAPVRLAAIARSVPSLFLPRGTALRLTQALLGQ
jgi:predicted PhzF superfamily epimerase YddE/YHI9